MQVVRTDTWRMGSAGRVFALAVVAVALIIGTASRLLAQHNRSIAQYKHSRWTRDDGTPTPVYDVVQARDGYLWVAAGGGLYRFDGIDFEKIEPVSEAALGSPGRIRTTPDGRIWAWFPQVRRLAFYQNGELRAVPTPTTSGRVTRLIQSRDGAIWLGMGDSDLPIWRYKDGRWRSFGPQSGVPLAQLLAMIPSDDGAVWVSYVGSLRRLAPGGQHFETVIQEERLRGSLAADREGRIWFTDRKGAYPVSEEHGRPVPHPKRNGYPIDPALRRGFPAFDADNNLWVGLRSGGISRLRAAKPAGPISAASATSLVDHFTVSDGLTSDTTATISVDDEQNIWIGTTRGLDRFRLVDVVSEPLLSKPAAYGDILLSASDGSVYVAQAHTVYRVASGGEPEPLLRIEEPESLCEDARGRIWLVDEHSVWVLGHGRRQRLPRPPDPGSGFYDCAVDRSGTLWLTAARAGMYRWTGAKWEPMFGPPDRKRFHPTIMSRAKDGSLIVLWTADRLVRFEPPDKLQTLIPSGSPAGDIATFYEGQDGLVVVGSKKLAQVRNGEVRYLDMRNLDPLTGANGIVRTARDVWFQSVHGVARVDAKSLDSAFRQPGRPLKFQLFGFDQGLKDMFAIQSWRSAVQGGDGRIWFATAAGTVWIDPARMAPKLRPPRMRIRSVVAAGKTYRDPIAISLPAGVADIQVNYSGISLAIPRGVKFRYKLEGRDRNWIGASGRREAFYTNLAPGTYRFVVLAANADGRWSAAPASVEIQIRPTFFQSIWFALLCGLGAMVLLWLLYRVRLAQVASRLRTRLEERAAERERIAREVHDTFLQSVQGLVLRFQAVSDRMRATDPVRERLEAALQRADEVIIEGRTRILGLRDREKSPDFVAMIEALVVSIGFSRATAWRVTVVGRPRIVKPLISAELRLILREALSNSSRHAKAANIEVTIRFEKARLVLMASDDGVGIPEAYVHDGGRDGHFGLLGMRERAARIAIDLTIARADGGGTLVTMVAPSRGAFAGPDKRNLVARCREVWRAKS